MPRAAMSRWSACAFTVASCAATTFACCCALRMLIAVTFTRLFASARCCARCHIL
jgi:hypothetical protein